MEMSTRDGRESTLVRITLTNGDVMERHIMKDYATIRQSIVAMASEGGPIVFDGADGRLLIVNFANVYAIVAYRQPGGSR